MFGTSETTVAAPYADAAARLLNLLTEPALTTVSHAAYASGQETLAQVGPFGAVSGLSKLVRVHFLEAREDAGTLNVPLRWEATGPTGALFPVLDADLILGPEESCPDDSPARTRLRLLYSYRPPLGRLGAILDAALLSRIADATIRSLLDAVAELLGPQQSMSPVANEF